jgi:hypothetical protein
MYLFVLKYVFKKLLLSGFGTVGGLLIKFNDSFEFFITDILIFSIGVFLNLRKISIFINK